MEDKYIPFLSRHDTVTVASTMVMTHDANCASFSKDVKQPQSSETHRRRLANIDIGVGSPGICTRFFPHWVKALAPDDIDSLTHCRAVRHAPVLRPRRSLDRHLRQLQRHRGFMRAILLLHDSGNQWNLTSSTKHEFDTKTRKQPRHSQFTNPDQARHPMP